MENSKRIDTTDIAISFYIRTFHFVLNQSFLLQNALCHLYKKHAIHQVHPIHHCLLLKMTMLTDNGYELMIQDYHAYAPGRRVGLVVKPEDIQVMKKSHLCNTFDGKVLDGNKVEFLDAEWDISDRTAERFSVGEEVDVEVDFERVNLQDDEEDGVLQGEVYFILYKGDHYPLQVRTDDGDDLYVDTNDVWDDGDRVGVKIAPSYIRLYKKQAEGPKTKDEGQGSDENK